MAPTGSILKPGVVALLYASDRNNPGNAFDGYFVRTTDYGTTYTAETQVNDNAPGSDPFVALDSCGNDEGSFYAMYALAGSTTIHVRKATTFATAFPDPSVTITSAYVPSGPLVLNCSEGGSYIIVSWHSTGNAVMAATSSNGVNFTENRINVSVAAGCGGCTPTTIVADIDEDGRAVAAWTDARNGLPDLFMNYSLEGGQSWQGSDIKATGNVSGASTVSLTVGPHFWFNDEPVAAHHRHFSLSYFDNRTDAAGIYMSNITFDEANQPMVRLAGPDRYGTSVAVSKTLTPTNQSKTSVVVASGENFPDAVCASVLANKLQTSLLLVKKNAVPAEIAAELQRIFDGAPDGDPRPLHRGRACRGERHGCFLPSHARPQPRHATPERTYPLGYVRGSSQGDRHAARRDERPGHPRQQELVCGRADR
ncbi:MAG: cell wall-binding repeat-containing protein [Candidatus Andersenbacteria bacterium]